MSAPILFVTWDGGGNVPPALATAAVLAGRGFPVRVLGHPQQRADVESVGLRFEPFRYAGPWSAAAPEGGRRAVLSVFVDEGIARDVTQSLAREPGIAVVDCMLLPALAAAATVPRVALVHTLYEFVVDRWGTGPIADLAAAHGLVPAALWDSCERLLVASPAELAEPRQWPGNVRFTGPVWPSGRPGVPHAATGPRILVSLSSVHYDDQMAVLDCVLDAVDGVPAEVVLTTGHGIAPDAVRVPANVSVHRYLSHSEVMATVSLVVGHGGHSTTMLALAHDLPLVIVPVFPHGDQPEVGRAVERAGAGVLVPDVGDPAGIRKAVLAMLADGPHRAAAARLGARLRERDGAEAAADEIAALIREQ